MRISILCSDIKHPINDFLYDWIEKNKHLYQIELIRQKKDLSGGKILFLVSCHEIINKADRDAYEACLVIHASDLPQGRGWSPHTWQVIAGAEVITMSLLEAEDKVDSGRIWKKVKLNIPKHALFNEINEVLFRAELELIDFAISNFTEVCPTIQPHQLAPTYYKKRTLDDSRIDPEKSISSQFNLIRVCDPERYPAFFELHDTKYKIILEKYDE